VYSLFKKNIGDENNKKLFNFYFFIVISLCFAINPEIVKNHNSPYFYGESETEELDEAKDKAL